MDNQLGDMELGVMGSSSSNVGAASPAPAPASTVSLETLDEPVTTTIVRPASHP